MSWQDNYNPGDYNASIILKCCLNFMKALPVNCKQDKPGRQTFKMPKVLFLNKPSFKWLSCRGPNIFFTFFLPIALRQNYLIECNLIAS